MSVSNEILSVSDIARLIRVCRRHGVEKLSLNGLSFNFWSENVVQTNSVISRVAPVETFDDVDLDILLASDPVAFEQKVKELGQL